MNKAMLANIIGTRLAVSSKRGGIKKIPSYSFRGSEHRLPSVDTKVTGGMVKQVIPAYSGTACVGISTMHKSNAVPVFSKQDILDISTMRR